MNAQDLKSSILQRAIEGKLVPQRQEEGTAKELLAEIRAEKARLIKEKKIKKYMQHGLHILEIKEFIEEKSQTEKRSI